MKTFLNTVLTLVVCNIFITLLSPAPMARAEDDPITEQEVASQKSAKNSSWTSALEEKYHLTKDQIQTLQKQGWSSPQIAIAAQLSLASGKPLDEIVKMREQKMGWGKIAKELGVPPKDIGQSIASLRKEINMDRQAPKSEKMERKADRAEDKAERAADKMNSHKH